MDLVNLLKSIAHKHFVMNTENGPDCYGAFRTLTTVAVNGEPTPLLIVGKTSKKFKHGSCVAILNPDHLAINHVKAGCYFLPYKQVLAEHCDALLRLWIKPNQPSIEIEEYYKAQKPQPGQFKVM